MMTVELAGRIVFVLCAIGLVVPLLYLLDRGNDMLDPLRPIKPPCDCDKPEPIEFEVTTILPAVGDWRFDELPGPE